MPLVIKEKPVRPAVDLDMLKNHLNMNGVDRFDAYLIALIKAIPIPAARIKGQTLIKTGYQWTLASHDRKIEMPRPPLIAVSKVEFRGSDGNWTEVNASNYEVNADAKPGFVRFANEYQPPDTFESEEYPWRFTYTAGYVTGDGSSSCAEVPANLRLWMMNLMGSQFMKRESDIIATNGSVSATYLADAMARLTRGENYNRRFG